ncbi:MAG: hypothetical protein ACON4P_08635 [Candidatus Puniceispirillales bacterium]
MAASAGVRRCRPSLMFMLSNLPTIMPQRKKAGRSFDSDYVKK